VAWRNIIRMATATPVVGAPAARPTPEQLLEPAGLVRSEDVYNEDGVDLTLIREFLRLTPLERLRTAEAFAQEILELRKRIVREP